MRPHTIWSVNMSTSDLQKSWIIQRPSHIKTVTQDPWQRLVDPGTMELTTRDDLLAVLWWAEEETWRGRWVTGNALLPHRGLTGKSLGPEAQTEQLSLWIWTNKCCSPQWNPSAVFSCKRPSDQLIWSHKISNFPLAHHPLTIWFSFWE